MIDLKDVVKQYQIGGETIFALNHVSLHMEKGDYLAVVGPSGSGKSTLMNVIGCLDTADSGQYFLAGKEISHYKQRELARLRSKSIGFIFQGFNLLPKLSAMENVELPLIYQNIKMRERRERARAALEKVGLAERMNHRPSQLSGGQQQRVAIARALVAEPVLILADEPTGNLDQKTGSEVMDLFDRLNQTGHSIVLITHDTQLSLRARRRVHIEDGKLTLIADEEGRG